MKKLMFAAVAAAMIGGVEAAGYVDCFGVYDFAATLKTTKGVLSNLKEKSNPCIDADQKAYVRKQATVKIAGIIWGCDCETIATPAPFTGFRYNGEGPYDGSAFWNTTDKTGYDVFGDSTYNTLAWLVLNRIDVKADKTEGIWNLTLAAYDENGTETPEFTLTGAGFGTAKGDLEGDCGNSHVYIPSMTGYVVGQRYYTCLSDKKSWGPCQDPEGQTYDLIWWQLCDCTEDDLADTVAYGSWTIKFNQSTTNKGAKDTGMNENVYKFPAYIAAQLKAYDPDPEPTLCENLKETVEECEKAVEATSYTNLKAAEVAAQANVDTKTEAAKKATANLQYAGEEYDMALAAYTKAIYQQTNVNATVIYKNASGDEQTINGVGCDWITAQIAKYSSYTLIKMETSIPGMYGIYTCTSWAACTDRVKYFTDNTTTTKKALTEAEANLVTAKAAVVTAQKELTVANDALTVAKTNLANITMLQYEAQKALDKAEAAYEAAGCEE